MTSTEFPLVLLPRRIVYVDDDGRMLDILRMTMPAQMSREFIGSPTAALAQLTQEISYWRGIERVLSQGYEQSAEGSGEAQHYATSYFRDWRRFHLTGVLIVDYAMPGLTGLELVRQLGGSPARRVLLTGEADAEVAVKAFNSGLIHKFIPKGTPNLYKEVTRSANEMHRSVCEHIGHLLRSTLHPDHVALLYEPQVVQGLAARIEELGWNEYVVVGHPFGFLGMTHDGPLQWLQIETTASLKELAEALPEYGYPDADVQAVASGSCAPVSEIHRQLGIHDKLRIVATREISASPQVCCALVDLALPVLSAKDYGVDDIRTPEELLRGLVRDVDVAGARPGDPGLDDAIAHVAAIASLSKLHAQALAAALGASGLDAGLKARIQAQVNNTVARKAV